MNIEDLTIKQIRELSSVLNLASAPQSTPKRLPVAIGEKLFVWTVTAHYTGRVTAVSEEEIELDEAAWIADDGRLSDALKTGNFNEVEPFPGRIVLNRGSFLHYERFEHELPRSQK